MNLAAVRASFGTQGVMGLLGATMEALEPGRCVLAFTARPDLTQQDGFVHAGVLATVVDSAGGYAAYTRMPEGSRVLTTDLQLRFLAPARGTRFECQGTVVKSGQTLSVCELRVEAVDAGKRTLVAYGTQGLICIR